MLCFEPERFKGQTEAKFRTCKKLGKVWAKYLSLFRSIIWASSACLRLPIRCSSSKPELFRGHWERKSRLDFALFDTLQKLGEGERNIKNLWYTSDRATLDRLERSRETAVKCDLKIFHEKSRKKHIYFSFHITEIEQHLQPPDAFSGSKYTKNAFAAGAALRTWWEGGGASLQSSPDL